MVKLLKLLINLIPVKSVRRKIRRSIFPEVNYFGNIKVVKNNDFNFIYKDDKCIKISVKHDRYLLDIVNSFDYYFEAVESENNIVDYSYSHLHKVKGYDKSEIMFPSFAEPITTTMQYIDFAKLDNNSVVIDLGAYSGLTGILFDLAITSNTPPQYTT